MHSVGSSFARVAPDVSAVSEKGSAAIARASEKSSQVDGTGVVVGIGVSVGVGEGPGVIVGMPSVGEYKSRFGEPAPALPTTLEEAAFVRAAATSLGEAFGERARKSAATPAVCGDAIDVPESDAVAESPVCQEESTPTPGANTSRHAP